MVRATANLSTEAGIDPERLFRLTECIFHTFLWFSDETLSIWSFLKSLLAVLCCLRVFQST